MCIRALDYCPPVALTFGDYLRALITADTDIVQDDDLGYRVAFIEAFQRRGIYPQDVRNLSVESLTWKPPLEFYAQDFTRIAQDMGFITDRSRLLKTGIPPTKRWRVTGQRCTTTSTATWKTWQPLKN